MGPHSGYWDGNRGSSTRAGTKRNCKQSVVDADRKPEDSVRKYRDVRIEIIERMDNVTIK